MDKQKNIINMFNQIAPKYDRANRILSLGIDTIWRKEAAKLSLEFISTARFGDILDSSNKKVDKQNYKGGLNKKYIKNLAKDVKDSTKETSEIKAQDSTLKILDVACGTGDMMLEWIKAAKFYKLHLNALYGLDPAKNMLEIAKDKLGNNAILFEGEATKIPLNDNEVNIISIAFGLRNVLDYKLALNEFYRTLGQNGLVVILEFTRKNNPNMLDKSALFYTTRILPKLGGFISKNYHAYNYLPNSINEFLSLEELEENLANCGFESVFKKRYIGNLCSLIIARKK